MLDALAGDVGHDIGNRGVEPSGLIGDHRIGLQVVGQGRRHIADLGADRLGMPAPEPLIGRVAGSRLDHHLGHHVGRDLVLLRQPEQPVGGAAMAGGELGDGLGPRQADIGLEQQLRQRRAAQAGAAGETGARQAGALDLLR